MTARIRAVEYIRRMRGGSQAKLMRCSDGGYYVVKFQNNPQGIRILANELLAAILAKTLGLPIPEPAVVEVTADLIRHNSELVIDKGWRRVPCRPGLCFGSRWGGNEALRPGLGDVYDLLPEERLANVKNLCDFVGMLAFDKWTGNGDDRQTIFVRNDRASPFRAFLIDNGLCFNGTRWNFAAGPKDGLFWPCVVYQQVSGVDAFKPWLDRIEHDVDPSFLKGIAEEVPTEWYGGRRDSLVRLLTGLDERRTHVRDFLWSTRTVACQFFPMWSCEVIRSPFATNLVGASMVQAERPRESSETANSL